MRKLLYRMGGAVCTLAFLVATYAANIACIGKYHQPVVPKELESLKRI